MKLKRKRKIYRRPGLYLTLIFFVAVFIGVGYSYLTSDLKITGTTTIAKATWDVHFKNLVQTGGNITSNSLNIDENSTMVNFDVTLTEPGDYYEFTVDVENSGTIDAMVGSIINTNLTEEQQKFITYTVNYSDGGQISENQLLKSGSVDTIKISIKYRDDVNAEDLPDDDQLLEMQLNIIYIQASENATSRV